MKSFAYALLIATGVICLIAGLQCSTLHASEVAPVLAQGGLSGMLQSPTVRTVATVGLLVVAAGALGWKPALKAYEAAKSAGAKLTNSVTSVANHPSSADELVRGRYAELLAACPQAKPEFLLKCLEAGMDAEEARREYIKVLLEKKTP